MTKVAGEINGSKKPYLIEDNLEANDTMTTKNINGNTENSNHDSRKNEFPEESQEPKTGTQKRAEWDRSVEFLMSCIAMCVGLGNIWRFPFTAYQNGGGAFLIPYIIVLLLLGRPIYYLDMCLGQFTSSGGVKMFKRLAPVLKGIGYGQCLGSSFVTTYYCSLIAISFLYLINSFTSNLPWSYCREEWKYENMVKNITCVASNGSEFGNGTRMSSSEIYFRREVLKEKPQIDDGLGVPEWRLALCTLLGYAVIFIITRNGIRSSGKAAYFLAIFPYVIMFTLLVRSATLEGANEGMYYFIKPNWERLLEAEVWYNAVTQCFFSLNIGFGSIIMFASYNNFRHNIYRDCLIVNVVDTCTSLLSGATIFGILGHLAFKLKVDVSEVINSGGTGLAFISYPEAIAKFDVVPWLFSILFFFMLFVLGIGSMVGMQGVALTIVTDSIPQCKPWLASLIINLVFFCISLMYITNGGQFMFTLVDYFGGTMVFYVLTILEAIAVFWWYGLENFCEDVEFMVKRKVGVYWRLCWGVINPVILVLIFLYFILTTERLQHENTDYPDGVLVFGWLIIAVGVLLIPLWWLYYIQHLKKVSYIERLKWSVSHYKWGPKDPDLLAEWKIYKKDLEARKSSKKINWLLHKIYILVGKQYY